MTRAYALSVKDRPGRTAYHAALTDFLHAPEITLLDCTAYKGQPGNRIRIQAIDDFRVTKVQVEILAADGHLVEHGPAIQQPNGLEWVYATTVLNADIRGCRIVTRAYDLPGNVTMQEGIIEVTS